MSENLIVALCNNALKSLTEAHELYRKHYGGEWDADWVSEQYNGAVICVERMRDAASLSRDADTCDSDSCPIHFPDEPKYDPDEFFSAERSGK